MLAPYPKMKPSGVEWLGHVPSHWKVLRGKQFFFCKKQLNTNGAEKNILSLTLRGVVNNDPENPEGLVPKDYATYQLFRKGDLVFKLIDLENFKTSRVGLVHEDGIMSPAYLRIVPRDGVNVAFFYRQYFDLYQRGVYNDLGDGVRATLGRKDLLDIKLLMPPADEQEVIVQYLDDMELQIRQFVQTKQKLIERLEEHRQALITRVVTRGLNSNVKFKESGVEWLGRVPAHWQVARLKSRLTLNDSGLWGEDFSDSGTIVLRSTEQTVSGGWQIKNPAKIVLSPSAVKSSLLKAGDIVVTKSSGSQAHIGKAALVGTDIEKMQCCFSNFMQRLRVNKHTEPAFVWQALNSHVGKEQFAYFSQTTTGLANLNGVLIENCRFAFPPANEQAEIVAHLNKATADIDSAAAQARQEIALVNEYRERLIADVVTGKLDARTAGAA